MSHPRFSNEEIARRGKELYEGRLRSLIETEEDIGKIVSIDIETGDYHIDRDLLRSTDRLHAQHPGAAVWSERIGYDAVYVMRAFCSNEIHLHLLSTSTLNDCAI